MSQMSDKEILKLGENVRKDAAEYLEPLAVHLARCNEWQSANTSSPSGEGVRGGDVSTPTERRAVPNTPEGSKDRWREDDFVRVRRRLVQNLIEIDKALRGYRTTTRALDIMGAHEARLLAEDESTIGSECINHACGGWIKGTPDDRSRSGRCRNCYVWWKDHGRVEDRPHNVIHREADPGCAQCARVKETV